MWNQGRVVSDWKDALIVPIPKKGDLQQCDNWRGISLLDVAGKVFARVIQERLSLIAERLLPDSQCGFRKGRGCVDMVLQAYSQEAITLLQNHLFRNWYYQRIFPIRNHSSLIPHILD